MPQASPGPGGYLAAALRDAITPFRYRSVGRRFLGSIGGSDGIRPGMSPWPIDLPHANWTDRFADAMVEPDPTSADAPPIAAPRNEAAPDGALRSLQRAGIESHASPIGGVGSRHGGSGRLIPQGSRDVVVPEARGPAASTDPTVGVRNRSPQPHVVVRDDRSSVELLRQSTPRPGGVDASPEGDLGNPAVPMSTEAPSPRASTRGLALSPSDPLRTLLRGPPRDGPSPGRAMSPLAVEAPVPDIPRDQRIPEVLRTPVPMPGGLPGPSEEGPARPEPMSFRVGALMPSTGRASLLVPVDRDARIAVHRLDEATRVAHSVSVPSAPAPPSPAPPPPITRQVMESLGATPAPRTERVTTLRSRTPAAYSARLHLGRLGLRGPR
jgi:hypothetical protein